MKAWRRWAWTVPVALLGGCALWPWAADLRVPVPVAEVPTEVMGISAVAQRIRVRGDGPPQVLDTLLELGAGRFAVAAIAFGVRLGSARWDGRRIRVQGPRSRWGGVAGASIVRDLVVAALPLDALRAGLPPPWRVADTAGGRALSRGGPPLLQVEYLSRRRAAGPMRIRNRSEGYELEIEAVPL